VAQHALCHTRHKPRMLARPFPAGAAHAPPAPAHAALRRSGAEAALSGPIPWHYHVPYHLPCRAGGGGRGAPAVSHEIFWVRLSSCCHMGGVSASRSFSWLKNTARARPALPWTFTATVYFGPASHGGRRRRGAGAGALRGLSRVPQLGLHDAPRH